MTKTTPLGLLTSVGMQHYIKPLVKIELTDNIRQQHYTENIYLSNTSLADSQTHLHYCLEYSNRSSHFCVIHKLLFSSLMRFKF